MSKHKSIEGHERRIMHGKTILITDDHNELAIIETLESIPRSHSSKTDTEHASTESRLCEEIARGELDVQAGKTINASESIRRMRGRYRL